MKRQILLIAATHGNEPLGVEVIEQLHIRGLDKYFDWLIANPRALKKRQEFIDANLNRSYPGIKNSPCYEERIAYDNLKISQKYKYIIDIHEASQGKDDFIIVPRKNVSDKFPLELIDLEKVLLWPDPKGPLSQVLENAIELEFGSLGRARKGLIEKSTNIIEKFIELVENKKFDSLGNKELYYVYGKLITQDFSGSLSALVDFNEFKNKTETFLPLLTKQYLKLGIICYKMRRIS